jgi:hypothetical protein
MGDEVYRFCSANGPIGHPTNLVRSKLTRSVTFIICYPSLSPWDRGPKNMVVIWKPSCVFVYLKTETETSLRNVLNKKKTRRRVQKHNNRVTVPSSKTFRSSKLCVQMFNSFSRSLYSCINDDGFILQRFTYSCVGLRVNVLKFIHIFLLAITAQSSIPKFAGSPPSCQLAGGWDAHGSFVYRNHTRHLLVTDWRSASSRRASCCLA